jgi:hypothetical protein
MEADVLTAILTKPLDNEFAVLPLHEPALW